MAGFLSRTPASANYSDTQAPGVIRELEAAFAQASFSRAERLGSTTSPRYRAGLPKVLTRTPRGAPRANPSAQLAHALRRITQTGPATAD